MAVAGCVGAERAAAFCKFIDGGGKPLAADAVLRRYGISQPMIQGWVQASRLDLVQRTLLNIEKKLQSEVEFCAVREDKMAWRNLGRFLSALPGDLREQAEEFFREREYPLPRQKKAVTK